MEAISEAVSSEIETELINAGHTNVLLLRQVIYISYIHILYLYLKCVSASPGYIYILYLYLHCVSASAVEEEECNL